MTFRFEARRGKLEGIFVHRQAAVKVSTLASPLSNCNDIKTNDILMLFVRGVSMKL